jgi:hypothetical protein
MRDGGRRGTRRPAPRSSASTSCRLPDGGWVVIELNGAVEFTSEYSEWDDVFAESALLLEREIAERRIAARSVMESRRWTRDRSIL